VIGGGMDRELVAQIVPSGELARVLYVSFVWPPGRSRSGAVAVPLRDVVDVAGHDGIGDQPDTWPPPGLGCGVR
jgi:hypothetical protein